MKQEQINFDECMYCDEMKFIRVWKQTGENVCYDCRVSMLDTEFENELREEAKGLKFKEYNEAGFDAYDMLGDTVADYAI